MDMILKVVLYLWCKAERWADYGLLLKYALYWYFGKIKGTFDSKSSSKNANYKEIEFLAYSVTTTFRLSG